VPTAPQDKPPTPSPSKHGRIIATAAAIVVVAVAVTLAFTVGSRKPITGKPTPATDGHTVAQTFVNLETERYNAGSATNTPEPSETAYAGVSCARDLAEMHGNGAHPAPLNPPHHLYSFAIVSISPTTSGRQLLRIARTTLASGDVGDGLFSLQRESGRWTVCGLFPDTQPSDPNANSGNGTSGDNGGGDAGSRSSGGPAMQSSDLQRFLDTFTHAVATGQVGSVAEAICADDPQADRPIESWTSEHAQIRAQVSTTGTVGGSASLQVSATGQPPTTYTAVITQQNDQLCIEILTQ
jgi:hypothetical protein